MKIGDIVQYHTDWTQPRHMSIVTGIVVGFNEKGEGGSHYVHVLKDDGDIEVHMAHTLEVIRPDITNRHGKKQKYLKED